jgi:hypothetical protein
MSLLLLLSGHGVDSQQVITARKGEVAVKAFMTKQTLHQVASWSYWGGGGADVHSVASLIVTLKGKPCHVPRSSYGDLAGVSAISTTNEPKGFHVLIRGGEAGNSFRADLWFVNLNLARRVVRSGQFPSHHWEETKYVNLAPHKD